MESGADFFKLRCLLEKMNFVAVFDQTELEVIEAAESSLTGEPEAETPAEAE